MEKIYSRTKTLQEDKVSGFCPGCMHSTVVKLIGEVLEELDVVDKAVMITGVGCCGLHMDYIAYDTITSPHGRAAAVATGMKRSSPDSLIFTYQGDGDLAAIGLGETISAANRGENISIIFVNNGIYGMTGGQMAPTTLLGQQATTAPHGRQKEFHGMPMQVSEMLATLGGLVYAERVCVADVPHLIQAKKAIKKAFEKQLEGAGFTFVEVLASCPTNWGMTPLEANRWVLEEMASYYPLGVIKEV